MHGKPVIAGANVYYARCGITVPASDCDAYFTQLNALAASIVVEDHQNADDAAMLYFIFHYLLQWPFPYDKPSQITAAPPKSLVNHPSIVSYIETLDVLAMDVSEFEQALPELMASEQIERRWGWVLSTMQEDAA